MWSGTAASWVDLHPSGWDFSHALAIHGNRQGGYVATPTGYARAALWTGTASSFVNLHPPSGITDSRINAMSDTNQVGHAYAGEGPQAYLWTGTAASAISLHPAGATESIANATTGPKQGGYAYLGGFRAALWSGSAASFVNLHPAGATSSSVLAMLDDKQVGWARNSVTSVENAGIWTGTAASFINLHPLLGPDYTSSRATGIGSDGVNLYVFGQGSKVGAPQQPVVWIQPLPESFAFALNKSVVAGDNSVQGTITASPTPAARTYTTYDNSSLVTTPSTVTLPANAGLKHFQITTRAVNSPINTTVYARRGSLTRSQPLTLAPLVPTALAFTPSLVKGGGTVSCRVVINGVAGPGGRTIAVFDNSANTTMPSTVIVPPGATQVIFNINTSPVASQKVVTVTARVSAGEKTGTFRINP